MNTLFCIVLWLSAFAPCRAQQVSDIDHYWDKFDFGDTVLLCQPERMDQAVAGYISRLKQAPPEAASSAIRKMMGKASADSAMFVLCFELYEKYLAEPDSPLRDESLFIPVLESVLDAPVLDDVHKIRPAHLLELARKNRVGEQAADFAYTQADGRQGTLYHTEADCLLLFFYDPDCLDCKNMTDRLAASPVVARRIGDKALIVLAVYSGEDQQAWENHLSSMPSGWINAHDGNGVLRNEEIYDLKAGPTLYLLGKGKKVLLKDATFEEVERYLSDMPE